MLERMAGVDDDILIETHGSFVDVCSSLYPLHMYDCDCIISLRLGKLHQMRTQV